MMASFCVQARDHQELESAVLEREHLQYLPAALDRLYPDLGGAAAFTMVPDMGAPSWEAQWAPLHAGLARLMAAGAEDSDSIGPGVCARQGQHAFILGSYRHWVTVVAHRCVLDLVLHLLRRQSNRRVWRNPSLKPPLPRVGVGRRARYELLLCDSANKPAGIELSDFELAAAVTGRKCAGSAWEARRVAQLRRSERFADRSDAGLLAVIEHGEEEYSRPGTKWERLRPAAYWKEPPRAAVIAAELQVRYRRRRSSSSSSSSSHQRERAARPVPPHAESQAGRGLQEQCCTREYIRAMRRVLSGNATGEGLFLDGLILRWVSEGIRVGLYYGVLSSKIAMILEKTPDNPP